MGSRRKQRDRAGGATTVLGRYDDEHCKAFAPVVVATGRVLVRGYAKTAQSLFLMRCKAPHPWFGQWNIARIN